MSDSVDSYVDANLARVLHGGRLRLATEILLPEARAGGRDAAMSLLKIYGDALVDGVALPGEVAKWVGNILRDLSEGYSFEEAAGVPGRSRGRKKERLARANASHRFLMAWHYGVLHKHERVKALAAVQEISLRFHRDSETVRAAWKEHKAEVQRLIALEVQNFGAPWPVRYRDR